MLLALVQVSRLFELRILDCLSSAVQHYVWADFMGAETMEFDLFYDPELG
jgi:hypothetical protein